MPKTATPPKLSEPLEETEPIADDLRLLTIAEVADRLSVNPDTVYKLCNAGDLPSVYMGPQVRRVKPADLRAYIDGLPTTRPAEKKAKGRG